uniref:Transmembrane protein n=1 Tax=Chromera velia CCMP2878 TaxID=1169474 RepID=A0A0G4FTH9_9ALVE|eukprot:Cvel_18661.t1-p1 / transcript=Cvel_18661.t1 / gene=Cvel_18661 / organism=Chromera_velia_CCMP2878 / gene_product=hypothetical protein / transcript_product=hypothetical protein / location=Cvel_scaffold1560:7118-13731(-) / protein_length=909 / sequence_SO=supercontig / SO=protein_coding / is_pseudo=false
MSFSRPPDELNIEVPLREYEPLAASFIASSPPPVEAAEGDADETPDSPEGIGAEELEAGPVDGQLTFSADQKGPEPASECRPAPLLVVSVSVSEPQVENERDEYRKNESQFFIGRGDEEREKDDEAKKGKEKKKNKYTCRQILHLVGRASLTVLIICALAIPQIMTAIAIGVAYSYVDFEPENCAKGSRTVILSITAPLASGWLITQYWLFCGHQGFRQAFLVVGWPLIFIFAVNWVASGVLASLDFDSARYFLHVVVMAVIVEIGVVTKNFRKVSFYDRKVKTLLRDFRISKEDVQGEIKKTEQAYLSGGCPFSLKAVEIALPPSGKKDREEDENEADREGGEPGVMVQQKDRDLSPLKKPANSPARRGSSGDGSSLVQRKFLQGRVVHQIQSGKVSDLIPTLKRRRSQVRGDGSRQGAEGNGEGRGGDVTLTCPPETNASGRLSLPTHPNAVRAQKQSGGLGIPDVGGTLGEESVFLKPQAASSLDFLKGYIESGLTRSVRLLKNILYPNGCVLYTVLCLTIPPLVGLVEGPGRDAFNIFVYLTVFCVYLVGQVLIQRVLVETEPRYTLQQVMVIFFAYRSILEASLLVTSARTGHPVCKWIDEFVWTLDVVIVLNGAWRETNRQKNKILQKIQNGGNRGAYGDIQTPRSPGEFPCGLSPAAGAPGSHTPPARPLQGIGATPRATLSPPSNPQGTPNLSPSPQGNQLSMYTVSSRSPASIEFPLTSSEFQPSDYSPNRERGGASPVSPVRQGHRDRRGSLKSVISVFSLAVSDAKVCLSPETKETFKAMLLGVILLKTILSWGVSVMAYLIKRKVTEQSILNLGPEEELGQMLLTSLPVWFVCVSLVTSLATALDLLDIHSYVRETLTVFVQVGRCAMVLAGILVALLASTFDSGFRPLARVCDPLW